MESINPEAQQQQPYHHESRLTKNYILKEKDTGKDNMLLQYLGLNNESSDENLDEWNLGSSLGNNHHNVVADTIDLRDDTMDINLQNSSTIRKFDMFASQNSTPNNDQNDQLESIIINQHNEDRNAQMVAEHFSDLNMRAQSVRHLETKNLHEQLLLNQSQIPFKESNSEYRQTLNLTIPNFQHTVKSIPHDNQYKQKPFLASRKSLGNRQPPIIQKTLYGQKSQNNLHQSPRVEGVQMGSIISNSLKKQTEIPHSFAFSAKKSSITLNNTSFTSSQTKPQISHSEIKKVLEKYTKQPSHQSRASQASQPSLPRNQKPQLLKSSMGQSRESSKSKSSMVIAAGQLMSMEKRQENGYIGSANKKYQAPIGKIDLITIENDWKEVQDFLSSWNISIETKHAFTKSEVIEVLNQIKTKIATSLQDSLKLERKKSKESQEQAKLLQNYIEKSTNDFSLVQNGMVEVRSLYKSHDEILKKMEECQSELKNMMLNSLMCLDFYKDLENYIQDERYKTNSSEALKQVNAIDHIIQQHGINALDFDTERIQQLIESIQEFVRTKALEKKIIEIDLEDGTTSQNNRSSRAGSTRSRDEQVMENNGLKIKVTKFNNRQPFNMNSMPALQINNSSAYMTTLAPNSQTGPAGQPTLQHDQSTSSILNRSTSNGNNRHIGGMCLHHITSSSVSGFQVPIRNNTAQDDIKIKNTIIARLREQLEHKMKKILELKNLLRQERDETIQKLKGQSFKDALVKLEQEFNVAVIRNTHVIAENKQLKKENEEIGLQNIKMKNMCKDIQRDNDELRKVLADSEGYRSLQDTVVQLSGILFSKKNDQLNTDQRQQLRSIFGNSSILQKLRQKILANQEQISTVTSYLSKSMQLNVQQGSIVELVWTICQQLIVTLKELSQCEIQNQELLKEQIFHQVNNYQQVTNHQETRIQSAQLKLQELKRKISHEQILEFMNQHLTDDQEKIAMISMTQNDSFINKLTPSNQYNFDQQQILNQQENSLLWSGIIMDLQNQSANKQNSILDHQNNQSKFKNTIQNEQQQLIFSNQKLNNIYNYADSIQTIDNMSKRLDFDILNDEEDSNSQFSNFYDLNNDTMKVLAGSIEADRGHRNNFRDIIYIHENKNQQKTIQSPSKKKARIEESNHSASPNCRDPNMISKPLEQEICFQDSILKISNFKQVDISNHSINKQNQIRLTAKCDQSSKNNNKHLLKEKLRKAKEYIKDLSSKNQSLTRRVSYLSESTHLNCNEFHLNRIQFEKDQDFIIKNNKVKPLFTPEMYPTHKQYIPHKDDYKNMIMLQAETIETILLGLRQIN